jgi:2-amino-4-hydroxy-6-hydroxymethyldihydropteridine diphosphokinase
MQHAQAQPGITSHKSDIDQTPLAMNTCYIGLGANLGDTHATLVRALAQLAGLPQTRLLAQSAFFSSAPIDSSGDDYLNAVAALETDLAPLQLLDQLQVIEQAHGRERPYHNAPRTLDLDLLLYGQAEIASERLTVPHPRMHQRAFILLPLLQIAPAITLPGLGPAQSFVAGVTDQGIRQLP